MNRYKHYLSFGFNCELAFALQHVGVFESTLFSWADIRGTDALIYGINNSDTLLDDDVVRYAGNMFFCNKSKIGFHGKTKFLEATLDNGSLDENLINASLNETKARLKYLEEKQHKAITEGNALVIVKWFADVFEENHSLSESLNIVRKAISVKYNTNDFDILYISKNDGINKNWGNKSDFHRTINNFSPRSNAVAIDKDEWSKLLSEFIYEKKGVNMKDELIKAAKFWSGHRTTARTRWWMNPTIIRHVNKLVCGEAIDGASTGLEHRMRTLLQGRRFNRGISVGCGNGAKELQLLKEGIVEHFDLFEISQARVDQGRSLAERMGVVDRVRFHVADAFVENLDMNFDLVYWDSALHHMLDVEVAIRWSRDRLELGGYFVMHDFVGPSRFQWTDFQLDVATRVRQLLPERHMINPNDPEKMLSRHITRPTVDAMIAADPTEAADSENILPALKRVFPNAEITLTGGVIYHSALNDVMANFDDHEDAPLLQSLLLLDQTLAKIGSTHFAIAIAIKE